jgi:hypothetical protein
MADRPKKLSDTVRALLTLAAMRNDHLIAPPKLPVAAARQVVRSLLNAGFAEEVPVPIDDTGYAWRTAVDGGVLILRATALGIARVTDGVGAAASRSIGAVTETPGASSRNRSKRRNAGGDPIQTCNPSENATHRPSTPRVPE